MTREGKDERAHSQEGKLRERRMRERGRGRKGTGGKSVNGNDRNRDCIYSNVTFEGNESTARPLERKRNPRQGMKLNVKGTGETQRSVRAAK